MPTPPKVMQAAARHSKRQTAAALWPLGFSARGNHQLLRLFVANFDKGVWRIGSASDSRSEGWEFESLWRHDYGLSAVATLRLELLFAWAHVVRVEVAEACSK